MDNSEMMGQMTQMAMVQSLTAMTESIQTSTAVSTQTYAAGLVGQEITVAVVEEGDDGSQPTNVKYGKVEKVSFVGGSPYIYLEGDKNPYPLTYVLGMGKIDNPFEDKTEGEGEGDGDKDPDTDGSGTTTPPGGVDGDSKKNSNPLYDPSLFI